jgi:predicted AAA+ superfamily ATPase
VGLEVYYFKNRNECDFVIKKGTKPIHVIEVCWELKALNEKREFIGLFEAYRSLGLKSSVILTYDQEEEHEKEGLKISVFPVWKWLLGSNISL